MPVRATKRGAERTPLDIDCDVLICGASFAGLTVARELATAIGPDGRRPDVVVVDRYEIGERQTSACAVPLPWLEAMGLTGALRQTFPSIVARTPRDRFSWVLPQPFATFDYRALCELLAAQGDFRFETAKVEGRGAAESVVRARVATAAESETGSVGTTAPDRITVLTDRGPIRAPLVVDALGWRRVLAPAGEAEIQPPDAYLSRGLEVHPDGTGDELELFLDRRYAPAGYGWSFPAGDEVRVGVGSFDPHHHVKDPTLRLTADVDREPHGFQGNWIPHRLRPATGDGIYFVGDSAGHCLPLSAEGIRPAFFFGLALGNELRMVHEGRQTREQALRRYAAISARHEPAYTWLLRLQRSVGHIVPHERLATRLLGTLTAHGLQRRAWGRYLGIMPATNPD
ncbi:MAG: NAD(P)/FAD-dependent oxidoreductase [Solirubrobacteraceae bacterium]